MMFGRKLEAAQDRIGMIIGSRVDPAEYSWMPWPSAHTPPEPFIRGGLVTDTRPVGVVEARCYSGVEAAEVLPRRR